MNFRHPWGPAAVVALTLGSVISGGAAFALEDPAERVQKTVLDNGLTILTLEDPSTPAASFQMWVEVGSKDEARYTGLAHLFEHMMFKGSKNVAPEEHARYVQARGGRINAYTSRDVTVYFEDVTGESLALVIDLEAERVKNLDISEETLTSERQVVIEERRLRTEDNPDGQAFEAIAALAWRSNTYRRPVIGWREDLDAATVEACREFFADYYVPNNIILSVVGDIDSEQVIARIESAFGGMEAAAEIPRNPRREPDQDGERRTQIEFEVRSPVLAVAWHAPAAGHEDAEALDVASYILSAGRSSRLYRDLVYGAQKALYAQAAYWELKDAGLFYAFAGVRPGASIDDVEKRLYRAIEKAQEQGVSEDEVAKAKRQLEVQLVEGLTTAHSLASRFGSDTVVFGRIRPLEERLARIEAVTPADVQRVLQTYLIPQKRSVVHVVAPAETPK